MRSFGRNKKTLPSPFRRQKRGFCGTTPIADSRRPLSHISSETANARRLITDASRFRLHSSWPSANCSGMIFHLPCIPPCTHRRLSEMRHSVLFPINAMFFGSTVAIIIPKYCFVNTFLQIFTREKANIQSGQEAHTFSYNNTTEMVGECCSVSGQVPFGNQTPQDNPISKIFES